MFAIMLSVAFQIIKICVTCIGLRKLFYESAIAPCHRVCGQLNSGKHECSICDRSQSHACSSSGCVSAKCGHLNVQRIFYLSSLNISSRADKCMIPADWY